MRLLNKIRFYVKVVKEWRADRTSTFAEVLESAKKREQALSYLKPSASVISYQSEAAVVRRIREQAINNFGKPNESTNKETKTNERN